MSTLLVFPTYRGVGPSQKEAIATFKRAGPVLRRPTNEGDRRRKFSDDTLNRTMKMEWVYQMAGRLDKRRIETESRRVAFNFQGWQGYIPASILSMALLYGFSRTNCFFVADEDSRPHELMCDLSHTSVRGLRFFTTLDECLADF